MYFCTNVVGTLSSTAGIRSAPRPRGGRPGSDPLNQAGEAPPSQGEPAVNGDRPPGAEARTPVEISMGPSEQRNRTHTSRRTTRRTTRASDTADETGSIIRTRFLLTPLLAPPPRVGEVPRWAFTSRISRRSIKKKHPVAVGRVGDVGPVEGADLGGSPFHGDASTARVPGSDSDLVDEPGVGSTGQPSATGRPSHTRNRGRYSRPRPRSSAPGGAFGRAAGRAGRCSTGTAARRRSRNHDRRRYRSNRWFRSRTIKRLRSDSACSSIAGPQQVGCAAATRTTRS